MFRTKDKDSILRAFHCIAFIEYMFTGKTLLDFTNYFI